jgi:ActR/RegA family two-component response regulator/glycine cleavage system H lipoate-binding protein
MIVRVIFMLLACLVIDLLLRQHFRRLRDMRERQDLEKLQVAPVRLAFSDDAPSLRRVEVAGPKARILAVDDEKVVLDSYRRILAPEGYSIDTVETGPEALSLLRLDAYDFVITDLKMPDMDGVEVVKAVKVLRPDVDVVVITGYGTIETAVETMARGACEYLRKPFTADELAGHVQRLLLRRQARLQAAKGHRVRVLRPSQAGDATAHEDAGQGGAFLACGHTWVWVEPGGQVRVGIDHCSSQAMGPIGEVVLPAPGLEVRRGDPLFSFRRGAEQLSFPAPVSGRVQDLNGSLGADPARVSRSPYRDGWICRLDPSDLAGELGHLRIGGPALAWLGQEAGRLQAAWSARPDSAEPLSWAALAQELFAGETTRV